MKKNTHTKKYKSRQALKALLSRGDLKKIETISSMKSSTVYRWFTAENDNNDVEIALNKLLDIKKQAREQKAKSILKKVS